MLNTVDFFEELKLKIKLVISDNIANSVADGIKDLWSCGTIVVASENTFSELALAIAKQLAKGGFEAKTVTIEGGDFAASERAFFDLADGKRHYLAVGSGFVADDIKKFAGQRGESYSVVPTAPSTEAFTSPYYEDIKTNTSGFCGYPKAVFVDKTIINECPENLVAAGFGRVAEWWLKTFDLKYLAAVYGRDLPPQINTLSQELIEYLNNPPEDEFCIRLLETLLKIGALQGKIAFSENSVTNFLTLSLGGRLQGEVGFLSAYVKQNLYRQSLKIAVLDTLPPQDTIKNLNLVEKNCGWEYNNFVKNLPSFCKDEYFKSKFIFDEYRLDLFNELNRVDLSLPSKIWRRLYPDAGYWLKGYISAPKLMRLVALSAAWSSGYLWDIKNSGALEHYI